MITALAVLPPAGQSGRAQRQPNRSAPAASAPAPNLEPLREQAPAIHLRFLEALQRDLRGNVARVRLYLEDERTVKILLEHVVEHVLGVYERWSESAARLAAGVRGAGVEVLSTARLRETLRDVCGDGGLSSGGYGRP